MSTELTLLSTEEEGTVTIAYDFTLKRPGCALVQAAFGATLSSFDLHRMDNWLLHPTDDMRFVQVSKEQVEQLVQITQAHSQDPEKRRKKS
jgi:hypothetical protein